LTAGSENVFWVFLTIYSTWSHDFTTSREPQYAAIKSSKFPFWEFTASGQSAGQLLFLTLLTAVYITWLLMASSGSPG